MHNLNYYIKEGIGILEFDMSGSRVNVLNTAVMTEFSEWLNAFNQNDIGRHETTLLDRRDILVPSDGGVGKPRLSEFCDVLQNEIKAVMIVSRKPGIFIAGADIHEIQGIVDKKEGEEKSRMGQEVFERLERLRVPTVAVINGACLGGGLELALACRYRVSGFDDKIKIGLPEVQLGVVPGFGGTVRLPKIVGPKRAIELITSGKPVSSREAFKIGLVNWLFQDKGLMDDSFEWFKKIINKQETRLGPARKKKSILNLFSEKTTIGRAILFSQAKKLILKQTKGKYPAPLKALLLIKKGSYRLESRAFGELVVGDTSKNLIKLFFLNERYKKEPWVSGAFKQKELKKCGLLGAGVMGGGIAQLLSFYNIPVRMKDLNLTSIAKGFSYANGIYQNALRKKRLRPNEALSKMALLSGTTDYTGFKTCDLVIEAVVEDLEIKKKVFGELSNIVREDAVLASNTSALSISNMGKAVKNPARVVGMHFFNPVHLMPLIEVIRGEDTSDETIYNAVNFSRRLGKVVIVVKDSCGFLVNRLLLPYLNEAGYIFQEGGLDIEEIDRIVASFGMPMGPFTLMDEIGLDVGYKVAGILEQGFGKRMEVCGLLKKLYEEKLFGKKTGAGFYIYRKKKRFVNGKVNRFIENNRRKRIDRNDVIMRILCLMVNEAARCLEEGIVSNPSDVDIGMIMGTGFPPFRGGLLRYADTVGIDKVADKLKRFRDIYGERFETCRYLVELANKRERFYR